MRNEIKRRILTRAERSLLFTRLQHRWHKARVIGRVKLRRFGRLLRSRYLLRRYAAHLRWDFYRDTVAARWHKQRHEARALALWLYSCIGMAIEVWPMGKFGGWLAVARFTAPWRTDAQKRATLRFLTALDETIAPAPRPAPFLIRVLLWVYSRPFTAKLALATLMFIARDWFDRVGGRLQHYDYRKGIHLPDRAWVILNITYTDALPYNRAADAPVVRRAALAVGSVAVIVLLCGLGLWAAPAVAPTVAGLVEYAKACIGGAIK